MKMKNVTILMLFLCLCIGSFTLTAQELTADDRVTITQVNRPYIGVFAFGYQGVPTPGYPQFQLNNYGGVPGSVLATADNSTLGAFTFSGHNGSAKKTVSVLRVRSMENFATNLSAKMDFLIGPNREQRMTILGDSGNVGIGTETPLYKFTLGKPNDASALTLAIGANTDGVFNNPESGRLQFSEDLNYTLGSCGFEFHHDGNTNSLTLSSGCGSLNPNVVFKRNDPTEFTTGIQLPSGAIAGYVPVSDASGNMIWTDPTTLSLWETNGTDVYRTTGNVGIGTSSPTSSLHVVGAGSEIARFEGTGSKWIGLYDGTDRKGILWSLGNDMVLRSDDVGGAVRFQTEGNNDRMTINATGVGIGTTTPSASLHVDGDGNKLLVGASGGTLSKLTVNAETGVEVARFRINGTTQMMIDANGDIGMGGSPSAKLDVVGDTELNGDLNVDAGTFFVDASTNDVGVNTAAPLYTFDIDHVSGIPGVTSGNGLNIRNTTGGDSEQWTIYNSTTGQLRLYQAGVIKGSFSGTDGVYTPGSDRQLKTNITPVEDDILDKINELKPTRYHFKTNTKGHKEYGLIAQEVQKVFPELTPLINTIEEGGDKDLLGVSYMEFVPILIKGMQEQQSVIESQNEEIERINDEKEALVKELSDLKNSIQDIQAQFDQFENDLKSCCFNAPSQEGTKETQVTLDGNTDAPVLEQNAPNPFNRETLINYYLPRNSQSAQMVFTDLNGKVLKTIDIEGAGFGRVKLNAGELSPGTYAYTLFIDGKRVDTKQMVLMK